MSKVSRVSKAFGAAVLLAAMVFAPSLALGAIAVTGTDLIDSRSTPAVDGVVGAGGWTGTGNNGFEISWSITNVGGAMPWSYTYTITGDGGTDLSKDLSHWILQVSDNALASEFDFATPPSGDNDPTTYATTGTSGSNPNMPNPIFGFKFDDLTVSFTTTHAPVWGDFYAKNGNNVPATTAWNVGLGLGTLPDANTTDFTAWIAVPDGAGVSVVPEPASLVVWGLLLTGGVFLARRRRAGHRR